MSLSVNENVYSPVMRKHNIFEQQFRSAFVTSRLFCCGAGRERLGMGKYGVTESQRGNWNVPGRLTGSPGNGKDRRKGILVTPASKKNYFPISNIDKPESYLRAQIKSQVEF